MNGKTMTTVVWHAPTKKQKIRLFFNWMNGPNDGSNVEVSCELNKLLLCCVCSVLSKVVQTAKFIWKVSWKRRCFHSDCFFDSFMELVSITLHGDQFICDVSVKTEIKSDEQHPQQWNQKTQIRNRYNWWQWDSTHQMLRGLFICSDINGNIISDLNVCQCFCSHIFYLTSARMENRCTPVRYG